MLEAIARNKLNTRKVIIQWPDMLRVAGSLVTNQVRAYDRLRMFAGQGSPTPLGQAFAEYDRIDKTMRLLSMLDPMDSSYRRSLGKQLSVQESRHRLAHKICHGNSGRHTGRARRINSQLLDLSSMPSFVELTVSVGDRGPVTRPGCTGQGRGRGAAVPLGHAHLNRLGRHAIASSAPDKGLRPLGTVALPEAGTANATVVDDDGI